MLKRNGQPCEQTVPGFNGKLTRGEMDAYNEAFATIREDVERLQQIKEALSGVAERWAKPTNGQLKARLLMAAAFQRAFTKSIESPGVRRSLHILNCFEEVYSFLMKLNNRASNAGEIVRLLHDTPKPQLSFRFFCEWLFDEDCWRTLSDEIKGGAQIVIREYTRYTLLRRHYTGANGRDWAFGS